MNDQSEFNSRAALCRKLAQREPSNRTFWMAEAENWSRPSKGKCHGDANVDGIFVRLRMPSSELLLGPANVAGFLDLDQPCWPPIMIVAYSAQEVAMRKIKVNRTLLAIAALAFGTLASINWSPGQNLSFAMESAQARVGRPLTPVSVAGVARRTTRRAVVGGAAVGAAATHCARVLVNGAYVCR